MSAREAQNDPSGISAGQRGPRTHDVPHEFKTKAPSGVPSVWFAAKRIEITHIQCDQLPPRGSAPNLSRVLVASNPTLLQIGTQ